MTEHQNQKGKSKMEYQDCVVTVSVGDKEFNRSYKQVVRNSVTTDDILKLLSDEKTAKDVINNWHYGTDLKAKSEVRNAILSETAGPERAFEASVKQFMKLRAANGKPVTEEKARAIITAMQESE
jgi:hypothetical protein